MVSLSCWETSRTIDARRFRAACDAWWVRSAMSWASAADTSRSPDEVDQEVASVFPQDFPNEVPLVVTPGEVIPVKAESHGRSRRPAAPVASPHCLELASLCAADSPRWVSRATAA